jgi:uncharacterized membrane protein
MAILNLIMRWLHLFSAITAVGSSVFLRVALLPTALRLSNEARSALLEGLAKPVRLLIHASIGGLLLSGLYNTHVQWATAVFPYPLIYAIKVSLALTIFVVAILLTSSDPRWAAFQANRKKWLTLNVALAAVLVALSAYLRTLHQ